MPKYHVDPRKLIHYLESYKSEKNDLRQLARSSNLPVNSEGYSLPQSQESYNSKQNLQDHSEQVQYVTMGLIIEVQISHFVQYFHKLKFAQLISDPILGNHGKIQKSKGT